MIPCKLTGNHVLVSLASPFYIYIYIYITAYTYIYIYIFFCVRAAKMLKKDLKLKKKHWKSVENGQGLCITNTSEAIPLRF